MKTRTFFSFLFFPLTIWYGIVVYVRNLLYDFGLISQSSPHITTIGVGNLAVGGTGKTPQVEYLLDLLSHKHQTAMLSRGYRRKSKGFQYDDGKHTIAQLGDEAAMIATKFPNVKVAVCNNRAEGVRRLMEDDKDLRVIVLDDIFQHRKLHPSYTILLTDYHHPFYDDMIMPFGNLRESKSARRRANIIIVTKCPPNIDPITMHNMTNAIKARTYQKVFFSCLQYSDLSSVFGGGTRQVSDFKEVLCVSGIANPESLIDYLKQSAKVSSMAFPDHHDFTKNDMQLIVDRFNQIEDPSRVIVTTEKDAIRLVQSPYADMLKLLPIYSIGIKVDFLCNGKQTFDNEICSIVDENIIYQRRLQQFVSRPN